MRLGVIACSLFASTIATASVSPFQLAHKAYRGAYQEVRTESGRRVGSYGSFCLGYRLRPLGVFEVVMEAALSDGSLAAEEADRRFKNSLRSYFRSICRR